MISLKTKRGGNEKKHKYAGKISMKERLCVPVCNICVKKERKGKKRYGGKEEYAG